MPDRRGFIASRARRLCISLSLVPLLAACTVETSPGHGGGPSPRPPVACTMEYAPVCGERGIRRQTFPNACEARSRGFDIAHRGQCRGEPAARICTREYAPVCAERGGRRQTFSNSCLAQSDGFRVVSRGECRRTPPPPRPDRPDRPGRPDREPERMCTMEYAPVCAERGGRLRTFPNACSAGNDGYRVVRPGECRR